MQKITKKLFYRFIFCVSIIVFIIIQIIIYQINLEIQRNNEIEISDIMKIQTSILNNLDMENNDITEEVWRLNIPTIELIAPISEGTTSDVLNEFIGHFEETQIIDGNIGLAAHNRGYNKNYFSRLKELKEDDEIIYEYGQFKKIYEVKKNKIIKDTDWKVLENTEENTLTLITCIENEPYYRRCVIAEEKK